MHSPAGLDGDDSEPSVKPREECQTRPRFGGLHRQPPPAGDGDDATAPPGAGQQHWEKQEAQVSLGGEREGDRILQEGRNRREKEVVVFDMRMKGQRTVQDC